MNPPEDDKFNTEEIINLMSMRPCRFTYPRKIDPIV
jgi:hypothetical protein